MLNPTNPSVNNPCVNGCECNKDKLLHVNIGSQVMDSQIDYWMNVLLIIKPCHWPRLQISPLPGFMPGKTFPLGCNETRDTMSDMKKKYLRPETNDSFTLPATVKLFKNGHELVSPACVVCVFVSILYVCIHFPAFGSKWIKALQYPR